MRTQHSFLVWLTGALVLAGASCSHEQTYGVVSSASSLTPQVTSAESSSSVSKKAFSKGVHLGDPERALVSAPLAFDLSEAEPKPLDRRLLHYTGYLEIQALAPADPIAGASALAIAAGGYVELARERYLVLRVPVARFHEVFDAIETLGTVLHKSLTVEDISDSYQATDLRLATLRTTRDRLQALLAKARNEKDRVTILKELQEVTEKIDEMETALSTLTTLGALSTITLDVRPFTPTIEDPAESDVAALRWIHALSASRYDVAAQGRRLEVTVPEGFVLLAETGLFRAESADRTSLWASRRPNQPRGDTAFWVEAVRRRLEPRFADVEAHSQGDFQVLIFTERGTGPYQYAIALHAHDDQLDVIEAYFPSVAARTRHGDAVLATIRQGVP